MVPVWIEPAHVGCLVGSDGSRSIQTDRLDDQGASDRKSDAKASHTRSAVYLFQPSQMFCLVLESGLPPGLT
jgi:hypothetical protein